MTYAQLSVDPEEIGGSAVYPLVISAVVPRPIAFICSQDAAGTVNLSPYSYFNAMAHDPPILVMGAHKPFGCSTLREALPRR